jgi:hypothetical protein
VDLGAIVAAVLVCGVGVVFALVQRSGRAGAERALAAQREEQKGLQEEFARITAWNQHLSRYQSIVDVEREVASMRQALAPKSTQRGLHWQPK